MLVLGLQGSPRLRGNTGYLLSTFLEEAGKLGARTRLVEVDKKNIVPCKEYVVCEKKGFCPIDDDMKHEIYPLLREAEVVVAATPIFFYNMTAQLKALVDRCQTMWARKYRFKLKDPAQKRRKGFLLSVGATKGKNLFEGLELAIRYFFDALDADYAGSLTYRGIEHSDDMRKHPTVKEDVRSAVNRVVGPLAGRKKILFACEDNAFLSQMAGAFAQIIAGDRLDVATAGVNPAEKLDSDMVEAMREKKIDMKFRNLRSVEDAVAEESPETVVCLGQQTDRMISADIEREIWKIDQGDEASLENARRIRDEIERKVSAYVETL